MTLKSRKLVKAFSISSVLFFFLCVGIGYFLYTQFQSGKFDSILKKQLQQILTDNKVPIQIESLKLEIEPKEFLQGKIKNLDIVLKYLPTSLSLHLKTPVIYELKSDSIHLEIQPKLLSKSIPDITGKIVSDINFKRNGTNFNLTRVTSLIDLITNEPIHYSINNIELFIPKFSTSIAFDADLTKNEVPDFSLTTSATNPKISLDDLEIEDKSLNIKLKAHYKNEMIQNIDFALTDPIKLSANGYIENVLKNPTPKINFNLSYSLKKLLAKLKKITNIPLLKQTETDGHIQISGELKGTLEQPDINSTLTLKSPSLKVFKQYSSETILDLSNVNINLPIYYPLDEADGIFQATKFKALGFDFNNIDVDIYSNPEYVEMTLKRPISAPIFGSSLNIDEFELHLPFYTEDSEENETRLPGIDFPVVIKSKVSGGPFQISKIQKDTCVFNDKLIEGELLFNFPKVFNSKEGFHALGSVNLTILGGTAEVKDLRYFWGDEHPKVAFHSRWDDLDLFKIGELIKFGDMRGSLDGNLNNAIYALTDIGPIPLEYDFTVQGKPRSGKVIRFYGRAVNNILELLGSRKQEMPWYAQWFINMSMGFRNYFPATADYMGFRAKTEGGWTELYTFDPPTPEYSKEKEKTHYILSGTAFKIPLNTYGVYPAIMKTDAFQGWLWGMVDYFRKLNEEKNNVDNTNECTPFWKR